MQIVPPQPIPAARLLFSLDPRMSHLNHGSFGAVPVPVRRAQQRLRDEMDADPMAFFTVGLLDRLAHTRRHLARFLGADGDLTALIPNATAGAAVALRSLRLTAGDEIVLTNHGYNAVSLAVERERRVSGVLTRVVRLPLAPTDDEVVAAITAAADRSRTRLVVVDQITSPTAQLLPVERIATALRERGIPLLVDAAHVPGMLPVSVSQIGADFWVGNLHKWAFAAPGSAMMVVRDEWRDRVEPLVVSHEQPTGYAAALEWQGTLDYTAWLASSAGLYTLQSLGIEAVREHNAQLAAYGQSVVAAALGVGAEPGLPRPSEGVSMAIVPLPDGVATTMEQATALRLKIAAELQAQVNLAAWEGRGLLRLSAQVYNRPAEYERLAERLPGLLHGA